MSINKKSGRQTFRRRFVSGSLFVSPCLPECTFQSTVVFAAHGYFRFANVQLINRGWIKCAQVARVAWKPKMHDDVMLPKAKSQFACDPRMIARCVRLKNIATVPEKLYRNTLEWKQLLSISCSHRKLTDVQRTSVLPSFPRYFLNHSRLNSNLCPNGNPNSCKDK